MSTVQKDCCSKAVEEGEDKESSWCKKIEKEPIKIDQGVRNMFIECGDRILAVVDFTLRNPQRCNITLFAFIYFLFLAIGMITLFSAVGVGDLIVYLVRKLARGLSDEYDITLANRTHSEPGIFDHLQVGTYASVLVGYGLFHLFCRLYQCMTNWAIRVENEGLQQISVGIDDPVGNGEESYTDRTT